MTPRSPRRRALTALVLGPLLCGVLLASAVTAAWVALGEPVPAQGAVWFQVTKLGSARNDGGPQQPFFALVLLNLTRTDLFKPMQGWYARVYTALGLGLIVAAGAWRDQNV